MPFKCIFCHGYRHFARTCKKKIDEEVDKEKGDQWTKVQKPNLTKQGNKVFGQRVELGTSSKSLGQNQKENGAALKELSTQNNFAVLSISEEQVLTVLEEGEVPLSPIQSNAEVRGSVEPTLNTPMEGHSSTYEEM